MSAAPPPLTLHRRLAPGDVVRRGTHSPYRAISIIDGERHAVRHELVGHVAAGPTAPRPAGTLRPLLALAHVTDLQLADVQSPIRFEFFNREFADPRFAHLVPVQRPQEALTAHAVDATIRTLNAIGTGPATGTPLDLAVTTGDAIDNAQWNEVQAFLALFDGGLVRPGSGGPNYEGVQSLGWPDDFFWKPDGELGGKPDIFRTMFGFPHRPGVLAEAMTAFRAGGLHIPWLACFGNHEGLVQGVGRLTPELAAAGVGGRKPLGLHPDVDLDRALDLFIESAHVYLAGETVPITPDAERRAVSRREFVEAHFRAGARPHGHGFTERNRLDGTAYYTHDVPGVRLIGLDTTCLEGAAAGCLDVDQLRWLEDRLVEVHSTYRAPDGDAVSRSHEDRLVILFSHHGLDTLTNDRAGLTVNGSRAAGGGSGNGLRAGIGGRAVGAAELRALLHRFPNVVLWLNGHTHTNGVRPRIDPLEPRRGFWEVTTCAVVDWPCQTRLVELADAGDGLLSITCTMVDHDSSLGSLSELHRELAGNLPFAGFDSHQAGAPWDRNVELRLRAPFPLRRVQHS